MDKIMTMATDTDVCAVARRQYVRPLAVVVAVCEAGAMLAASEGWTTTDKNGGKGIVEEDKNNPYDDDSFGAKENIGDWE